MASMFRFLSAILSRSVRTPVAPMFFASRTGGRTPIVAAMERALDERESEG